MEQESLVRDTKVIAVGNQKGGVGKSTNCCHLAAALGERGKLCLVWDLDVNCGATRHFGIPPDTYFGTFELVTGEEEPDSIILTSDDEDVNLPENVHLIAAGRNLEGLDGALGPDHKFFPAGILIDPLKKLYGRYDYIFLDTAPSVHTTTLAAYIAANYFILSTTPQRFSVEGLQDAARDIQAAIRRGNSTLRVLGVVVSDVDKRTRLARLHLELIENVFRREEGQPSAMFETIISRSTMIGEAQRHGQTLFQVEPTHKVTHQYRKLAEEVEKRLEAFKTAPEAGEGASHTSRGVREASRVNG
jgi:chromosome partitioning protein